MYILFYYVNFQGLWGQIFYSSDTCILGVSEPSYSTVEASYSTIDASETTYSIEDASEVSYFTADDSEATYSTAEIFDASYSTVVTSACQLLYSKGNWSQPLYNKK